MKKYILKNLVNYKLIVVIGIIFSAIGILTNRDLIFLEGNFLDSIIYSFNLLSTDDISIDFIKVITIYIGLFFIISTFIARYLVDMKYLCLLRIRSTKKYILYLFFSVYTLIVIYFIAGNIIILLFNVNLGLSIDGGLYKYYYSGSYLEILVYAFVINILISIFFANLMIFISLYTGDIKKSIYIVFTLFLFGSLGISNLLPGYSVMVGRNIAISGTLNYVYILLYVIEILISFIAILQLIKRKRDFALNEYNY